jgi:hypothetical protein
MGFGEVGRLLRFFDFSGLVILLPRPEISAQVADFEWCAGVAAFANLNKSCFAKLMGHARIAIRTSSFCDST